MFRQKRQKPVKLQSLEELEPLMEDGKPILLEFFQLGCAPCRVMGGIVDELADEYAGGAHVVKVNVGRVPGAVQAFKIRSTPTFILLGYSQKTSKKGRRRAAAETARAQPTPRWRTSGLVRKDRMANVLESNGAVKAESSG
jgi:thioredoxin 1